MSETRFYLEMLSRADLRPAGTPMPQAAVVRQDAADAHLSRRLYEAVGRDWNWVDRVEWSDGEWTAHLSKADVETWLLLVESHPAGYFELRVHPDRSVEIAYFGLVPSFIGRGLGGYLLTEAVARAWTLGAGRVWLRTSSRDHPRALANYEARGFRIYRTEER